MATRKREIGSLHELLTNKPHPDKIYQFWLFPTQVIHSYHHKDARGEKIPLTKGVYPLHRPLTLESDARMYINKQTGKEAQPTDKDAEMRQVTLRYSVGEYEILKHLQTPDKDKKHKVVMEDFVDGHISIRGTEVNKLRIIANMEGFANNPNRNKRNKPIFFLRDVDMEADAQMKIEDERFEIESFVRDAENFDVVCAYARVVLGKSEYENLSDNPKMIVMRMLGLVKQNPAIHFEGLKNPANLKLHYIMEALDNKIIYVNPQQNAIYMTKDNTLIQMSPIGIDVLRKFAENIYEDVTGATKNKYEMIVSKLPQYKAKVKETKVEEPEKDETEEPIKAPTKTYDEETLKSLLSRGEQRGLIKYFGKAGGFKLAEGTLNARTFMGFRKFKEEMENNAEFANTIEEMLA